MKKYTQKEFDKLPIVDGRRQCPMGNYTQIDRFGERCSFGDGCSFGGECSFGEWCSFEKLLFKNNDTVYFVRVNNIGSRNDGCMIFNAKDGQYIRCGCWFGSVDKFLKVVKENHGGTAYEKQYQLAVELAKARFGE